MLLATRCPFCETVFRVQPAQLAARRGLVRCGHCREAFDASGSLFEVAAGGDFASAVPVAADMAARLTASEPASSSAGPATAAAAAAEHTAAPDFSNRAWDPWAPQPGSGSVDPGLQYTADQLSRTGMAPGAAQGVETNIAPDEEPSLAPTPQAAPASSWRRVEPGLTEPTLSAGDAAGARAHDPEPVFSRSAASSPSSVSPAAASLAAASPGAAAAAAAPAFSALSPNDGAEPFAVTREAPARAPRRTGWRIVGGLVALVLLALLGAQLAWWLRETVMVYWPDSQPLYVQACQQIGCRVMPPRDIDGLQVEPSDLRQVDDPHHLELKVPLRNHFSVALAYPAIELTLLDRQNNVVVRRVLWPQDYVSPGTHIEAGLPARTTQTMIVRLDTGNVVASNFRIEIFYP
ncbi:zinc-ribbon and DUF3426 domain-containing protein [Paraburkholderia ferrariae]|uniref:zinc-ribbon and DUF3426 domain-containing protein n=1 Tax=Paraburkholderia ferrariae TaxID=386056 RepID=UPI000487AC68|nr:zinc-ribbon and DUF3426 domain-containing protein [Paraburkholderia ferrariae]